MTDAPEGISISINTTGRSILDTVGPDTGAEAVARFMQREYGVALDPATQVNHCIGSKSGLAILPCSSFLTRRIRQRPRRVD